MIKEITGGVCAAKGFKAGGIHCGIRKNKAKKDLAIILSEAPAQTAAVYTTNLVKGAPLTVTKKNISNGVAQAIICNSGNANTCNADGIMQAEKMCVLASETFGVKAEDVVVASTGVIGVPLDVKPIESSMSALKDSLSDNGSSDANQAIMTTDTKEKSAAVEFTLGGKTCHLGAIAKGSGMIHPNMATMLVFITTDAAITGDMLQKALSGDIQSTFNMVSVDGDTSTNDMVVVMANSAAGNKTVDADGEDFEIFMSALNSVTVKLCKMIAGDGEGATKTLECKVCGADSEDTAKKVAKSVICSSLVKAAMFGSDANWGRVLCAAGYSGASLDVNKIDVAFSSSKGRIEVCKNGSGVAFSEEKAKEILLENEVTIEVSLGEGSFSSCAWGCDLTYDYVKINGDYRT